MTNTTINDTGSDDSAGKRFAAAIDAMVSDMQDPRLTRGHTQVPFHVTEYGQLAVNFDPQDPVGPILDFYAADSPEGTVPADRAEPLVALRDALRGLADEIDNRIESKPNK